MPDYPLFFRKWFLRHCCLWPTFPSFSPGSIFSHHPHLLTSPSHKLYEPLHVIPGGKWKSTPQDAGQGPEKGSRDGKICLPQSNISTQTQRGRAYCSLTGCQVRGVSVSTQGPPWTVRDTKSQHNQGNTSKDLPTSLCLLLHHYFPQEITEKNTYSHILAGNIDEIFFLNKQKCNSI